MSRQSYGLDVKLQYTSNYVDLICILITGNTGSLSSISITCYGLFKSWIVDVTESAEENFCGVLLMLEVFETICQCARILPHSECVVSVRCVCVCKRLWGVMIQAPAYL